MLSPCTYASYAHLNTRIRHPSQRIYPCFSKRLSTRLTRHPGQFLVCWSLLQRYASTVSSPCSTTRSGMVFETLLATFICAKPSICIWVLRKRLANSDNISVAICGCLRIKEIKCSRRIVSNSVASAATTFAEYPRPVREKHYLAEKFIGHAMLQYDVYLIPSI